MGRERVGVEVVDGGFLFLVLVFSLVEVGGRRGEERR